ncbi:hypothetical protein APA_3046 [Pseudanabaena sp. lw0831]|nr:hypothetical protein APA_3046 [Pseudanabaena sp. lw0831]
MERVTLEELAAWTGHGLKKMIVAKMMLVMNRQYFMIY